MPRPTTAAEDEDIIRLDLNENLVLDEDYYRSVKEVECDLSRYPEEGCKNLRNALAELYDLLPEQFVLDSGSDAVLDTIFKALVPSDGVLGHFVPSYSFYDLFSDRNDIKVLEIPLNSDLTIPTDLNFTQDIDMLVLCSPNNPTGLTVKKEKIERLLEKDISLVVDEAYVEYSDQKLTGLLNRFDNLVLVRTFSKAWGLAGIRLGYAVTSPSTAMDIRDIKLPYSISNHSLAVAENALANRVKVDEGIEEMIGERERMLAGLDSLGFNTLPTQTNFITARPPSETGVDELRMELLERGFQIRALDHPRLREYVRITVADEETNDLLLEELEDIFLE